MTQGPSEVGFELKGRSYTPDEPCLFDDHCTPDDVENWYRHVGQWLAALAARAGNDAQREIVRTLQRRADEARSRTGMLGRGQSAVRALVSTAKLAKLYSEQWSPDTVTEVSNDWGWLPPLELPIPGWLDEVKMRAGFARGMIPLIVIALLLLNNQRKGGTWL